MFTVLIIHNYESNSQKLFLKNLKTEIKIKKKTAYIHYGGNNDWLCMVLRFEEGFDKKFGTGPSKLWAIADAKPPPFR